MILQCKRNIGTEGLTACRLYPVIAYKVDYEDNMIAYQIVDDCRSLSWSQIDKFEEVSNCKEGYIKTDTDNKIQKYIYKDLTSKDFFVDYYLENEESLRANEKLESTLVSILGNELAANKISTYLEAVGYQDENADLLMKAFFLKANKYDVINFSRALYEKLPMLNNYIIQIVIEKLSNYRASEIESIFVALYINGFSYNEEIMNVINSYLGI